MKITQDGVSTGRTAHTRPTNPSKPVNIDDAPPPLVVEDENVTEDAAGMRRIRDPISIHSTFVTNEKEIVTFSFESLLTA